MRPSRYTSRQVCNYEVCNCLLICFETRLNTSALYLNQNTVEIGWFVGSCDVISCPRMAVVRSREDFLQLFRVVDLKKSTPNTSTSVITIVCRRDLIVNVHVICQLLMRIRWLVTLVCVGPPLVTLSAYCA